MKKRLIVLAALALLITGCKSNAKPSESKSGDESTPVESVEEVEKITRTYEKVESETLCAKKVIDKDSEFIMGMDVSSVLAEEASGVKYYNFAGEEEDLLKILSDNGVNYIRVRIWNNPFDSLGRGFGGGNNDLASAIKIGKRATANKMRLLVDFHYSDFWADPGKQQIPRAWEGLDVEARANKIYEFTRDSLLEMKKAKIDVGMVQVGNETNNGSMCGSKTFAEFATLFAKGSKAVRDVYPNALVACHFANPEKEGNYMQWARKMDYYNLDYDVFGSSYYPYWHGSLENLSNVLSNVATTYNKRVMVMETSYAFTYEDSDFGGNTSPNAGDAKPYPITIAGQANHLNIVADTIANKTTNGIGVCYWEGAWITVGNNSWEENSQKWEQFGSGWAASPAAVYSQDVRDFGVGGSQVDNQTFFDKHGHALESLKMFNLVRFGNEGQAVPDGVNDVIMIKYTTDEFTLPETVDIVYTDNSVKATPVVWDDFDIAEAKRIGNAKYEIKGVAGGYEVTLKLTIMEENYILNYSFEDYTEKINDKAVSHDHWDLKVLGPALSSTNTAQATSENPQTGSHNFNFWSSDADSINFELEQEVEGLATGNYKYQFSLMGAGKSGDAKKEGMNIYGYIKINDEIVKRQAGEITAYGVWSDVKISGIEYTAGQKMVVGVHVEVAEAGAWGSLDDFMLNLVL